MSFYKGNRDIGCSLWPFTLLQDSFCGLRLRQSLKLSLGRLGIRFTEQCEGVSTRFSCRSCHFSLIAFVHNQLSGWLFNFVSEAFQDANCRSQIFSLCRELNELAFNLFEATYYFFQIKFRHFAPLFLTPPTTPVTVSARKKTAVIVVTHLKAQPSAPQHIRLGFLRI